MSINKGNIGNALHSVAPDHTVAVAADIYDETLDKYQSELNQQIGQGGSGTVKGAKIGSGNTISPDASGIVTLPNYTENATPHIAPSSTEVKNALGATGSGTTKYLREDGTWQVPDYADVQEYVNAEATTQTTAVTDVLPATGSANVIYRVGNWNGTAYDATVYSEYSWQGSAYVHLLTKEYGIDDEPTPGSTNMVKSGNLKANFIEKVDTSSVNLYNPAEFINGKYIKPDGTTTNLDGVSVSNYIPVNGQNITLRLWINPYNGLAVYDKNLNVLRCITTNDPLKVYTYQYQSGDEYIRATVPNTETRMANYGNAIKTYVPYNPIDLHHEALQPEFSITGNVYLNRQIKELYIKGQLDQNKYYGIYSCWKYDSNYQFYIMSSDDESLPGSTIIAHYDSSTKPEGVVKLTSVLSGVTVYAVLDIDDVSVVGVPYRELLNMDVVCNPAYSPAIYDELTSMMTAEDFTVELYADGSIVFNNQVGSSPYTGNYAVYKISGNAITKKRDFVFLDFSNNAGTCQLVTAWDENNNCLGSFGTQNGDATPMKSTDTHDMLVRTSDYAGINYLLFCIKKGNMPTIKALEYDNLSFAPENKKNSTVIVGKTQSQCNFTKFIDAIDYANKNENTTILVQPGVYDLIEEFGADYFANMPNTYYQGLKVGNGTIIKATGNGVVIKAQYTGSNVYVGYQYSIFNTVGTYTVEGVSFIAQNTRYVIHDDLSISDYPDTYNYIVTFKNCKFNHKGSTMYDSSQSLPCSIGGGCSRNSMHVYENCIFESEANNTPVDLSYHNNGTSNSKVVVTSSYFAGNKTIASRAMGSATGKIEFVASNNRFGTDPSQYFPSPNVITFIGYNNATSN